MVCTTDCILSLSADTRINSALSAAGASFAVCTTAACIYPASSAVFNSCFSSSALCSSSVSPLSISPGIAVCPSVAGVSADFPALCRLPDTIAPSISEKPPGALLSAIAASEIVAALPANAIAAPAGNTAVAFIISHPLSALFIIATNVSVTTTFIYLTASNR